MYHILANGAEIASTHCPNNAVSLAMKAAETYGADSVTAEIRDVWGPYAKPELIGTPHVWPFNWKRSMHELMS